MGYLIKAGEIYLEDRVVKDHELIVEDGLIKKIGIGLSASDVLDLSDYKLLPGLIDTHVHGGNGFDTMDCTYESLNEISKFKIAEGVTSFCPTTVTAPISKIKAAVQSIDDAIRKGVDGAKIIGASLEGPYICKRYKGAHPESFIRDISLEELGGLLALPGSIAAMTIAPEKANAIEAIKLLKAKGIVAAIGHCDAGMDDIKKRAKSARIKTKILKQWLKLQINCCFLLD